MIVIKTAFLLLKQVFVLCPHPRIYTCTYNIFTFSDSFQISSIPLKFSYLTGALSIPTLHYHLKEKKDKSQIHQLQISSLSFVWHPVRMLVLPWRRVINIDKAYAEFKQKTQQKNDTKHFALLEKGYNLECNKNHSTDISQSMLKSLSSESKAA